MTENKKKLHCIRQQRKLRQVFELYGSLWLPCHVALSPIGSERISEDKSEIKDCSKSRQVRISFIRRTLY